MRNRSKAEISSFAEKAFARFEGKGGALRNGTMRYTQHQENSFRDMLSAALNGDIDGVHIHAVACGYSACEYMKNDACFVVVVLMPYTLGYPAIAIRARGPNGAGCQSLSPLRTVIEVPHPFF